MKKLKRNAIKCNSCGDIIDSVSAHDLKFYSCGRVAVDGGLDYTRRIFTDSTDDYTELSEYESD